MRSSIRTLTNLHLPRLQCTHRTRSLAIMTSAQQKALYLDAPFGKFVVRSKDIQKPEPAEVLIKVSATALNPADWKIQKYNPPFVKEYPFLLGSDIAGVVEDVGEGVTTLVKGDRVYAFRSLISL